MADGSKNGTLAFDQYKLDVGNLMLYRDGEEISIAPKIAKTLAVLVESAGSIISKDELIERVWHDSIVEEANLTQYLYILRKTLGSMPDGRPYIETLRRRGYRFNGQVERVSNKEADLKPKGRSQSETAPAFSGVEREGNVLRVVDWQPAEAPAEIDPAIAVSKPSSHSGYRRPLAAVLAVALVVVVISIVGAIFVAARLMPVASNSESQSEISVTRLTNGLLPGGVTISPDGNVFVYHELDGEISRMYVQQVGQISRIEIASSADKLYGSKMFSPEGQSIYYVSVDKSSEVSSLNKIPTMGGGSVKIVDDIFGIPSISPDGREIVFCRRNQKNSDDASVVIVGSDGRGERIVLQRKHPDGLLPTVAWSPDGKSIVFGELDRNVPRSPSGKYHLQILDVATGNTRPLSDETWDNIFRLIWHPDGSGIFMIGTRRNEGYTTRRDQVYFVSYPAGKSHRLTTDGNRYEPVSLGVTKKGEVIAVTSNRSSQIWVMSPDGDATSAVQLTKGVGDGRAGIGPLPEGRFGYLARTPEEIIVMLANADASSVKPLGTGFQFIEELRSDPVGRYFVFSSLVEDRNHLFKVGIDGGDAKQLTFGNGSEIDSSISPDGKYIVFSTQHDGKEVAGYQLMRMPADGGEPALLANDFLVPNYSPDGSMISCIRASKPEIVVLSASDGSEIQRFPLPAFATWNFGIGWTADGSGLIYIATEKGTSNLWVQPRDGAKPRALTNFSSGIIYRYVFSWDGSKLYLSRGYPTQDAILIKNFRATDSSR
jgi:DNA-binding winged helix-turn-helix (wHTH) protein/Tol biopolymer transport system component